VIENRPGASTIIGTEAVSHAAPDGKTVLMVANSFLINPHLRKLTYDPLTRFEPICHLVNVPLVVVVNSASPYRTFAALLNAARSKPGDLTIASFGPASPSHIAIEALKRLANINMTYIPYPGDAPAVSALLGEHVTSAVVTYTSVAEQLKAGKLRALAATSGNRIEPLPDLPTVAEAGYSGYEENAWFGLVAPEKTPTETVSQLAEWFATATQAPEVKPKLVTLGLYAVETCGAEFGTYLRKQYDQYGNIIRQANIKE
jgi:tripartite-type tricarboxylate transporter receptor subunit TctC